jgi:folate-binding protein YgfZ
VTTYVIDRSERGKLALTGPDARDFLQGQVSNDVASLADGSGCWAAFLTPKGKMLGDLRVLDAGAAGLLLDCERVALQELFNMIRRFSIGFDVGLEKRTLECGLLSVLGPSTVAAELPEAESAHVLASVGGCAVRAIRTDVGVDLLCDAGDTGAVSEALIADGVASLSEEEAEIYRVESGRPRYGVDLDETVIPQEAGLNERLVSFTKGCYVGQETVARLFYRGKPNRFLRGLRLAGFVEKGSAVVFEEREVGRVSSVVQSPRFGWIGLALVRREAPVGASVLVDGGVAAVVVELPFA